MKKIKLITLFILFGYTTYSQNLVPNPSFEDTISCPFTDGEIWKATPWFQPFKFMNSVILGSSSDLFSTCALYNPDYGCYAVKVPDNCLVGYQWPRTGNNYAGIGFWGLNDWNREYIEVKLISPLDSGHTYCIEYYVALADIVSPPPFMITGTDCLHAAFAPDSVTIDGANLIPLQPAIANTPGIIINDTANWTKIVCCQNKVD